MKLDGISPEKDWICFGQIGAPHGLKGAFFCETRDRTGFDYRSIRVGSGAESILSKVKRIYMSGGRPVLELDAVIGRNAAEALRGRQLFVHRSELELSSDEFLVGDLEGSEVFDESGKLLGIVKAVHDFGAQPNLEVEIAGQSSIYFPFISEFIIRHDTAQKRLHVRNFSAFCAESREDSL